MQLSKEIFRFLRPADEDTPETVHPGVRSLHHPPSRLPPRILFPTLCLFSPRSNRGNEVKSPEQPTHFLKVVSFIEAHALPFLLCRLRSFDRNAFDGLFRHPEIIPVRSVDGNANRDTLSFREQAPFCPLFWAVSGIRPSFFPSKRRFSHHSLHRTEAPVDALQCVVSLKASLPESSEYSRFIPFLEPAVGRA